MKDHRILIENPDLISQREGRLMEYFCKFGGNKAIIDTSGISEEQSGYELYNIFLKFNGQD